MYSLSRGHTKLQLVSFIYRFHHIDKRTLISFRIWIRKQPLCMFILFQVISNQTQRINWFKIMHPTRTKTGLTLLIQIESDYPILTVYYHVGYDYYSMFNVVSNPSWLSLVIDRFSMLLSNYLYFMHHLLCYIIHAHATLADFILLMQ